MNKKHVSAADRTKGTQRFLDSVEWAGNKLPDPAILFAIMLIFTWVASAWLAPFKFSEIDPRTGEQVRIVSLLSAQSSVGFVQNMVKVFIEFPPLGQVLVALLGVGVAEYSGFIQASLKGLLQITPLRFLTPMLLLVAILSHSAGDAAYVIIIPLGAVMYATAGRHPLLGITTAFAGVSGAFSASFLPSAFDTLLQGFTQKAAQIIDPAIMINPLCNWGFMSTSCFVIISVGWYVTDRIIEPRLQRFPLDGNSGTVDGSNNLQPREIRGLWVGYSAILICLGFLIITAIPANSPWRSAHGNLIESDAPLMQSIVPLLFILFLLPSIGYGYAAGTIKSLNDIVEGMTKAMGTISYYLVMAFFAAQFISAFTQSNVGIIIALKGSNALAALKMPAQVSIIGIILLTASVNLIIGSGSAKWALLSPIFIPMLMSLGISPELTQAAYRIGDSSTNIITPLMSYFPLIVVFVQRYVKNAGIGTLVSLMLPYSIGFLIVWSMLLLLYWWVGAPLGLQATYTYPPSS